MLQETHLVFVDIPGINEANTHGTEIQGLRVRKMGYAGRRRGGHGCQARC
jgi:hypothetical protein